MARNVMIDLETFGTTPDSAIRSISAVVFDIDTGKVKNKDIFYKNIDDDLNKALDFNYDKDTISWWNKQSKESQKIFDADPIFILDALVDLNKFMKSGDIVWANAPSFDCVMLRHAMSRLKLGDAKWKFWNERCVRTIVGLNPMVKKIEFTGIKHYAVDDCLHQINQVCKTMNRITVNKE